MKLKKMCYKKEERRKSSMANHRKRSLPLSNIENASCLYSYKGFRCHMHLATSLTHMQYIFIYIYIYIYTAAMPTF